MPALSIRYQTTYKYLLLTARHQQKYASIEYSQLTIGSQNIQMFSTKYQRTSICL